MKELLVLIGLFLASFVEAADKGPADMVLSGPDKSHVGSTVRLRLDGLPSVDLAKTMSEQLAWLSQVKIITAAPGGLSDKDYSVDQQLSIKVSPFQWAFSLDFNAKKPGDYVLIVDWNEAPFGLVHHRISVGGAAQPDPTVPPDDPDPQPPSTKVTRLTYVYEKDKNSVPRPVAKALADLNADSSAGVSASDFERDVKDGDQEIPDQYKVAVKAADKEGLPCLVAQAGDEVVKVVKDPKTADDVKGACQ